MKITANFDLEEFAPSGSVPGYIENNIRALAQQLQILRNHFNAKVIIKKGLSETGSTEQKVGSGAIFTVEGKNGDQVKAAFQSLISQGKIINGTIGLYDNNHVYFALTPIGQRFDKRTSAPTGGNTSNTGGGGTTQTPNLPATTQTDPNKKALMMGGLFLALLVVGMLAFKKDKKKSS